MRIAALVLLAGCYVPDSSSSTAPRREPPPPEVQPEWNLRATENARDPAYADRVKSAPRRAATEEISITMQADAMDFFRKSYAHHDTQRDLKLAVGQIIDTKSFPNLRIELNGGGIHETARDWFESMAKTQRPVDVYVRLTFRTLMQDDSNRACPGMRRPLLILISAVSSSAYVRNDHVVQERSYCRAGYPDDLGESVPQMRALVEQVLTDIDTQVRAELPALSETLSLTPPHRADWQWRRPPPDGRWFGIF